VRQQKTDKRDSAHILTLLREGQFPRLWTPSAEQRDLRQLLIHRHKLVEIRSRVKNGLQHLAMNRGMQKKSRLWSEAGPVGVRGPPAPPPRPACRSARRALSQASPLN
jgi:transposase